MSTATTSAGATSYFYDAAGSLLSTAHPNGVVDARVYDDAGRLTGITGKRSDGNALYSRTYEFDPVGNPLSVEGTDAETNWIERYSYDSRDRLTNACMNESCTRFFSYAYDPVGNRLSKIDESGTTTYAYNPSDQLTEETRPGGEILYAYDESGNQVQKGETRYAYDLEDGLTSVSEADERTEHYYSSDGLLAVKGMPDGGVVLYSWDTNAHSPGRARAGAGP